MPTVGILDYQAGNIRSIVSACETLGANVEIVSHQDQMTNCTHLILPGVGAFGFCVEKLNQSGLLPALREWAISNNRPTLGICVGMQMLALNLVKILASDGLVDKFGHLKRSHPLFVFRTSVGTMQRSLKVSAASRVETRPISISTIVMRILTLYMVASWQAARMAWSLPLL
jgi:glutamine amidotransferase PdxT